MSEKRLIDADAFTAKLDEIRMAVSPDGVQILMELEKVCELINEQPTIDPVKHGYVPSGLYEQVKWERDMAINQLNSYGVQFGEKADVQKMQHGQWLQTQKHEWYKNKNGDIDENRWLEHFCNGVECEICGKEICVHCNPKYDEAEDCILHYICSECGRVVKKEEPYCHCGAKMDLAEREDAVRMEKMSLQMACKILWECVHIASAQYAGAASDYILAMRTIESEANKEERHATIIETIKDGKFHRECSYCGEDCTTMTMWMSPKYCPDCGAKIVGREKRHC